MSNEAYCILSSSQTNRSLTGQKVSNRKIDYQSIEQMEIFSILHLMVSMLKSTQNVMQGAYDLVPVQDFSKPWTDAELYAKYHLTQDETAFIESMIKPME